MIRSQSGTRSRHVALDSGLTVAPAARQRSASTPIVTPGQPRTEGRQLHTARRDLQVKRPLTARARWSRQPSPCSDTVIRPDVISQLRRTRRSRPAHQDQITEDRARPSSQQIDERIADRAQAAAARVRRQQPLTRRDRLLISSNVERDDRERQNPDAAAVDAPTSTARSAAPLARRRTSRRSRTSSQHAASGARRRRVGARGTRCVDRRNPRSNPRPAGVRSCGRRSPYGLTAGGAREGRAERSMLEGKRVAVVVPAFDEEDARRRVTDSPGSPTSSTGSYVVDDHSSDGDGGEPSARGG